MSSRIDRVTMPKALRSVVVLAGPIDWTDVFGQLMETGYPTMDQMLTALEAFEEVPGALDIMLGHNRDCLHVHPTVSSIFLHEQSTLETDRNISCHYNVSLAPGRYGIENLGQSLGLSPAASMLIKKHWLEWWHDPVGKGRADHNPRMISTTQSGHLHDWCKSAFQWLDYTMELCNYIARCMNEFGFPNGVPVEYRTADGRRAPNVGRNYAFLAHLHPEFRRMPGQSWGGMDFLEERVTHRRWCTVTNEPNNQAIIELIDQLAMVSKDLLLGERYNELPFVTKADWMVQRPTRSNVKLKGYTPPGESA